MIGIKLTLSVIVLAFWTGSAFSQPSLQPGITQTQDALNKIERLMSQNDAELAKMFADQSLDFAGEQILKDFGDIKDSYEFGNAVGSGEYAKAIEKAGDILASYWGKADPAGVGGIVDASAKLINQAFKMRETQNLIDQQAQLASLRQQLQNTLYRLEGKDPKDPDQSWWMDVLQSDKQLHDSFQKWLRQNGITENQLDPQPGLNGATIVEPDAQPYDLQKIPGINPDFIEALQRCSQATNVATTAGYIAAMTCNKYPDGSYIPAFLGPGDGLGNPSPVDFNNSLSRAQQNQDAASQQLQQTQAQVNDLQTQISQAQAQVTSTRQSIADARQPISAPTRLGLPTPRIPAGWVPCTCPDQHPHAGLLVNGTRYHSAALNCSRYQ
jgi:hypothetical protein